MAKTELGNAYVQIVPSTKGISGSISSILNGEASSAGTSAGSLLSGNLLGSLAGSLVPGIGKVIEASGAAVLGAASGIAAGTAALTKGAVENYAEYEQLTGGIATIFGNNEMTIQEYAKSVSKSLSDVSDEFERNEKAEALVLENASKAWMTAGIDANTYMETVAGFSASLMQSVGGDTEEAAKIADIAMQDMSDNANKYGSDMGSIMNAYMGFAKQNYTMLDNLKLGYGGTRSEMERLLADAQELTGVKYDIDQLDDVYAAIHAIQDEMGITGTTAKEALFTISGAGSAAGAAWQNVLTAIGGGGDISEALDGLMMSLFGNGTTDEEGIEGGLVNRLVPQIETALDGVGEFLKEAVPKFAEKIGPVVSSIGESIANVAEGMGPALETVMGEIPGIIEDLTPAIEGLLGTVTDELPKLIEKVLPKLLDAVKSLVGLVVKALPGVLKAFVSAVPDVVDAVLSLVQMVAENLDDIILPIARELPGVLRSLITSLTTAAPDIISALTEALSAIFTELPDILMDMMDAVGDNLYTITGTIEKVLTTIIGMVAELLPVLVPKLMEAFTKYIDLFAQGLAASSTMFGTVIEALVKGIIEAVPAIAKAAAPLMMALSDAIIENLPIILLNMPMLILGIADGIISAIKETDWGKVWKGIVDAFKEFFGIHSPSTVFAELGDLLIQGLGGGFNDALSWIKEQIDSFVTLLIDNFKETLGLIGGGLGFLYDLGGQLVSGLVDGLKNNFANINVGEIAGGLKDQFKDLWDIHSPSGVFRDEIGKYLALGIGEGIEENVPVDSVSSAVSRLTSAASAGLGSINNAITGGIGSAGKLAMVGAGGAGDIIIPVYIGQERIDEIIVSATNRVNYKSGGRV